MSVLPIGRITSGVHLSGNYGGVPAATVQVLANPESGWVTQCAAKSTLFEDADDYPLVAYPAMERPMTELLRQRTFPGQYSFVGEPTLAGLLASMKPYHVVITGSEPCDYDMSKLFKALKETGRRVQIETRGAVFQDIPAQIWVTLRTTPTRDAILDVDIRMLRRANEVIAKIYCSDDIEALERLVGVAQHSEMIWIVPGRQEQRLYSMCVDVASSKHWRVTRPPK